MPFDVATFGEAMVRLTPPSRQRVEQAASLDVQVGGAELNTAVGLAQLGRRTTWVSRLTDVGPGRLIAARARAGGVDTRFIEWTAEHRVGLFFLEEGAAPRASQIVYDRRDSAFSHLSAGTIPWAKIFSRSRWFHVSGISLAVSERARAATLEAMEAARLAGIPVSFDPNYRSKLWSMDEASPVLRDCLRFVSVLITSEIDATSLFNVPAGSAESIAHRLMETYSVESVAFTRREGSAVTRDRVCAELFQRGYQFASRFYEVEVIDRIGAGDAFAAGLIDGLLDNNPMLAIEQGAAMAALKHTVPGDALVTTREEVNTVMAGSDLRVKR